MLRTLFVRNQLMNESLRKAIVTNITRCVSTEICRRKSYNKLHPHGKTLVAPEWSVQLRYYSSLPDHTPVKLPALSPTMENGSIVNWAKKEGDKLNEGDLLCEIETDKATMGFETPDEGYLAKILIPAGTKGVPVGKLLCIIVQDKDAVAAFKDYKDSGAPIPDKPKGEAAPAPAAPAATPAPAAPAPPTAAATAPGPAAPPAAGRVYASPFAKRLAELRNIRLGGQGSGLYGSVKSADLAGMAAGAASPREDRAERPATVPAPAPGASYVDIPLSGIREVIAKRLTASKQNVPHYQLTATVNIEKLLAMRKTVNEKLVAEKSGITVSVNDFIVKAVAGACKRVPSVNAHWMDSFIRQFSNVDVSVAVATPTGLITPILFNADSRGLLDLSTNMKALIEKAKSGTLQPAEFQGGTVTVSNLGMYGITMFNAIINPPQSLILACGGIQELVIADKNEPQGFRAAKFASFTASADHRVIDGAVGAQWMKVLKENLEDPANIIL